MKSLHLLVSVCPSQLSTRCGIFALSSRGRLPACNTPENRQCWGEFDIHTDYNVVFPETNIIKEVKDHSFQVQELLLTDDRQHDLVASNMWIAPDGVEVLGMVFNGPFPGPVIEARFHISNLDVEADFSLQADWGDILSLYLSPI